LHIDAVGKEDVKYSGQELATIFFISKGISSLEVHFVVLFCSGVLKPVYHSWSFGGGFSESNIEFFFDNIIWKVLSLRYT
jgi:hypothetical protein